MTSHGGVVISGNPLNTWYDIPIARMGDKVTCPKCKPHIFTIAEGLAERTDANAKIPMAAEGHLTTCGAVLIAQTAPASAIAAAMRMTTDIEAKKSINTTSIFRF